MDVTGQTSGALMVAPPKYVRCSWTYDRDGLAVFSGCLKYLALTSSKVEKGNVRASISTTSWVVIRWHLL